MRQAIRHNSAFTLIEMLVVVLLLAVFMVVISELFVVTTRAGRDSQKQDELIHRVDAAIALLRRDVWAASNITVYGPHLTLPAPDGRTVTWHCDPDGTLSRRVGDTGPLQSWRGLPPAEFAARGALLTLTFKTGRSNETATLVSQQLLAQPAEGAGK